MKILYIYPKDISNIILTDIARYYLIELLYRTDKKKSQYLDLIHKNKYLLITE